jgi:hypothetical protein
VHTGEIIFKWKFIFYFIGALLVGFLLLETAK